MWDVAGDFDRSTAVGFVESAARMWADSNYGWPDFAANGDASAKVTLTLPNVAPPRFLQWLGPRLVFWPDGVCRLKRVALVSSRLGLRHDQYSWWYDLLRTAVLRVGDGECLCVASGTTAFAATQRAAQLFGLPLLELETSTVEECSREGLADWLLRVHRQTTDANGGDEKDRAVHVWRAFLSPRLDDSETHRTDATASQCSRSNSAAVRDRALVVAGQRTYVLSCRAGGNVETLVRRKLEQPPGDGSLTLVASSNEVSSLIAKSLNECGAVPWIVSGLSTHGDSHADKPSGVRRTAGTRDQAIPDGPLEVPEQWLLHWTRPRFGPWPEQDENEFLDELILGCESSNRSALAALLRIASTGKLLASRNSVRGNVDVISWTAVPLKEFRQRRVFRRHRHRFDFEPWGVAVRQDALQKLGARAVVYGDEATRDEQPEVDRAFFQLATDRTGSVDWTAEREWRLIGSLDLTTLHAKDVCLFVDTPQQAATFDEFPWGVVVCPEE